MSDIEAERYEDTVANSRADLLSEYESMMVQHRERLSGMNQHIRAGTDAEKLRLLLTTMDMAMTAEARFLEFQLRCLE